MKTSDAIRMAFAVGEQSALAMIEDLKGEPLAQPFPSANHALWVVGHLAVAEGSIPTVLFGEPNPVAHWEPLFAPGSKPSTNPADYPPFEEVLATFKKLRARNLQILEELGEDGLSRPSKQTLPGMEELQGTAGKALLLIALHQMFHAGQAADVRRALQRKPVFM
jgi:uncharacterized damage-inducible protein DinB